MASAYSRDDMSRDAIEDALGSAEFGRDPHPLYRHLRETAPVYWSPTSQQWLVTSYDLVDEVLGQPAAFSSVGAEQSHIARLDEATRAETQTLGVHFATPQLNITDPPDHKRIRRAFGRPFLPREVSRYEAPIAAATWRLLDDATASIRGLDIVRDLAEPLPVHVVALIMGVPESHLDEIRAVTLDQRHFFGTTPPPTTVAREFDHRLGAWLGWLAAWIDERRSAPRDDVFTRTAEMVDAGSITIHEAVATCLHLIIAGNSTTTALIGNAIYRLLASPEQLDTLTATPSLIGNCIEETLRLEAPLPRDRRIAVRDCRLGDAEIRAGDRVSAVLAAANRDPAQFEHPDEFDLGRSFTTHHHASFGRGIHLCLGAPVARLEAAVAVATFLEAVPSPRLVPGFEPDWHIVTTHHGMTTLPVASGLVTA